MFNYRINFAVWRFRNVIQLLTMYFLWLAVLPTDYQIESYNQSLMLTYILGTSFISSIVISGRTQEIGENINKGDLSIFLIRPINYFIFWFFRDIGDKLMNTLFSISELFLIFLFLHPPFFFQNNLAFLFLFFLSITLAIILHFLISFLLGLIGFWSQEIWAPRFIFYVLISFFAGWLFPLDLLPKNIFSVFEFLPFTYLLYFPLKIYLGQLAFLEIIKGFMISLIWIIFLYKILLTFWVKGLKSYSAYGS